MVRGKVVADVLVVGLGAIGSAVTRRLAEGGSQVVGIDRYRPPHPHGSSHGSTRITRLAIGEGDDYVPIVQRSHALWRELEDLTGDKLMRTTGGLVIASPGSDRLPYHGQAGFYEQTVGAAERFGIAHERLDAAEIAQRFSAFTPAGDERGYWERDAGILFPERCVAAQLQMARAHGADVRCGVSLQGIGGAVRGRDGVVTARTDAGPIEAAHVVLTTGAWLPAMLPHTFGGRFAVQRQVLHWFPTDAPALYAPDHCPVFIWMHGDRGEAFYGFPNIGDYGTSIKVATEQSDHATTPEAVERRVSVEETAQMFDRHVRGRLRALRPQSAHDMTCLYTSTTDGRFVIDHHPELERVTIVSACSGHGFKHSAALGEAVADDLLGRVPRVDISSFKAVHA